MALYSYAGDSQLDSSIGKGSRRGSVNIGRKRGYGGDADTNRSINAFTLPETMSQYRSNE